MKSILISIQPQFVEKILNGEKTIEIRKTIPKCELPVKVYIYMTKKRSFFMANRKGEEIWYGDGLRYEKTEIIKFPKCDIEHWDKLGKVVAEFTLEKTECWRPKGMIFDNNVKKTCLTMPQLIAYADTNKKTKEHCFAWFINNLKIYDKPKELSEFKKDLDCDDYPCNKNRDYKYNYYDYSEGCWACGIDFDGSNCIYKQLTRPPQSWCYVEKVGE